MYNILHMWILDILKERYINVRNECIQCKMVNSVAAVSAECFSLFLLNGLDLNLLQLSEAPSTAGLLLSISYHPPSNTSHTTSEIVLKLCRKDAHRPTKPYMAFRLKLTCDLA